ncbi:MAG: helix-turn-helix domain-containing protein [Tannerellaceae bacterium]|nr:helix-turn-helix domain-containing protein [Tannerellaceae bacterium]
MNVKLTVPEKLKDLRVERRLTLEQLAAATGLSKAALGNYENDEERDKYAHDEDDLHMRTLELAQVKTEDYFEKVVSEDISSILCDIRTAHVRDATTADEVSVSDTVEKGLQEAMEFEGSPQEKQIRAYLAALGVDYDALTKDEFVTLIGILGKSTLLKNPKQSQRGKPSPYSKLSKKEHR